MSATSAHPFQVDVAPLLPLTETGKPRTAVSDYRSLYLREPYPRPPQPGNRSKALAELLSRRGLERPCETLVAWAGSAVEGSLASSSPSSPHALRYPGE